MFYAIVRTYGKDGRVLCELPDREWMHSGDYVVYANPSNQERIGIMLTPDFEDEPENATRFWGKPVGRIVAKLNRREIDWPEDGLMTEEPQMPEE